ncbi:hypothetical protein GCM10011504_56860 [Siccirubricoccus deserti]|uniref:Uncharacterized protein n=1 Tax=Siccirubricoccus deserti TaxID=2013562 RepID=A0A9X0R3I2_9PROT|nr:hypothetical protein [Siccirubricoccus deserti]MBC4019191.1 hypothetical protein [Siccirubricoccus deserti]GGC71854.1 hypothetical protein GCM10011504_56860 [Siccirubricoccus deserti]
MPHPQNPPAWLAKATLQAMQVARDRCLAAGGTGRQAAEAVRLVALAHGLALPATLIAEAVAAVVPLAARATGVRRRGSRPGGLAKSPESPP